MKRIMFLLPALLLSLLLTGCGRAVSETPDSYLPTIMLDGVLYHLSDKGEMSGDVDPSAIQGEITSTVPLTQPPRSTVRRISAARATRMHLPRTGSWCCSITNGRCLWRTISPSTT